MCYYGYFLWHSHLKKSEPSDRLYADRTGLSVRRLRDASQIVHVL